MLLGAVSARAAAGASGMPLTRAKRPGVGPFPMLTSTCTVVLGVLTSTCPLTETISQRRKRTTSMTMHGRRLRRFTALLTGGALVGGALLAAPIGAAAPAAAADGTTITPNPALRGRGLRGLGHEPRVVRERHRRLSRGAARGSSTTRSSGRTGSTSTSRATTSAAATRPTCRTTCAPAAPSTAGGRPTPTAPRGTAPAPPSTPTATATRRSGTPTTRRRYDCDGRRDAALVGRRPPPRPDHALGDVQPTRRRTS